MGWIFLVLWFLEPEVLVKVFALSSMVNSSNYTPNAIQALNEVYINSSTKMNYTDTYKI